ncbi:MAG TPA: hypothetical protein P5081_19285 [Phycisphaerae bacterium]|nr:hypothetical protein [Phycisphaerae bacterium]HRW55019.1 hypothetical protein [Phycisphaerae bacterium]
MEETEVQPVDQQDAPIVDAPAGGDGGIDSEIEALLRHAEILTEVITSNTDGPLDEYLESIADVGPVEASPRPPVTPRPPPELPPHIQETLARKAASAPAQEPAPAPADEPSTPAPEPPAAPAPVDEELEIDAALATSATTDKSPETDDQTAEIDAILQEAGAAPTDAPRNGATPPDLPDLLNDPDDAPTDDVAVDEAAPAVEVLYIPDEDAPETAFDEEPPPEDVETEEVVEPEPTPVEAPAPEVDEAPIESATEDAATPEETPAPAPAEPSVPGPRLTQRLLGMTGKVIPGFKKALRVAMSLPATTIGLVSVVLAVLNKPFEGFSNRARDIMGLIAVATMICGVLAWVLPWLLTSNPFSRIPLGIVTEH